jgi:hypothetical protein
MHQMGETMTWTSIDDEPSCQDRARDGLQHLQAAARELIQAARTLLDVAEDVVDDPAAVATLVGALGALGDVVRHRVVAATGPPSTRGDGAAGTADDQTDGCEAGADGGPRPTIERITVA